MSPCLARRSLANSDEMRCQYREKHGEPFSWDEVHLPGIFACSYCAFQKAQVSTRMGDGCLTISRKDLYSNALRTGVRKYSPNPSRRSRSQAPAWECFVERSASSSRNLPQRNGLHPWDERRRAIARGASSQAGAWEPGVRTGSTNTYGRADRLTGCLGDWRKMAYQPIS